MTEQTVWAFRAKSEVEIGTLVIRLGDLIEPIDQHLPAWPRLSRTTIGLVPVGGQTMVIQRERLTRMMLNLEATPKQIQWMGSERITVRYRQGAPRIGQRSIGHQNIVQRTSATMHKGSGVHQVGYAATDRDTGMEVDTSREANELNLEDTPTLTFPQRQRAIHWANLAIKRYVPAAAEQYAYEIAEDQPGLAMLHDIGGVTDCRAMSALAEGDCLFHITTRGYDGIRTTDVMVRLEAHPVVVVPTRSLGRGHRVLQSDLKRAPIPAERLTGKPITDLDSVVGMEVRTPLRVGRPVQFADVGAPILIHRGDLIEVRVLGGGVMISTNAKALSNGALGELLEIETISPRRRIVAKVAEVGIAEIVTRAPVIR